MHTILYAALTYSIFLSHLAIIKALCQDSSILFIITVVYNSFSYMWYYSYLIKIRILDISTYGPLSGELLEDVATRLLGYIRT